MNHKSNKTPTESRIRLHSVSQNRGRHGRGAGIAASAGRHDKRACRHGRGATTKPIAAPAPRNHLTGAGIKNSSEAGSFSHNSIRLVTATAPWKGAPSHIYKYSGLSKYAPHDSKAGEHD